MQDKDEEKPRKKTKEDENEVGEDFTIQNVEDVKIGGDAISLPPEDKPKVEKEFELEKDPQQVEEKKKEKVAVTEEIVDQLVEENKEKIIVTHEESTVQGVDLEPSEDKPGVREDDAVIFDDNIRTLTGADGEQVDPVRGTKPNERGSVIPESDKDFVASSGAVSSDTSVVTQQPTAANIVVGWGVFLGQSAVGVISYLTPNFVKSAYGKGKAFFTSLGEIKRFFCPKK